MAATGISGASRPEPHPRADGAGCPQRRAEYSRRQPGQHGGVTVMGPASPGKKAIPIIDLGWKIETTDGTESTDGQREAHRSSGTLRRPREGRPRARHAGRKKGARTSSPPRQPRPEALPSASWGLHLAPTPPQVLPAPVQLRVEQPPRQPHLQGPPLRQLRQHPHPRRRSHRSRTLERPHHRPRPLILTSGPESRRTDPRPVLPPWEGGFCVESLVPSLKGRRSADLQSAPATMAPLTADALPMPCRCPADALPMPCRCSGADCKSALHPVPVNPTPASGSPRAVGFLFQEILHLPEIFRQE